MYIVPCSVHSPIISILFLLNHFMLSPPLRAISPSGVHLSMGFLSVPVGDNKRQKRPCFGLICTRLRVCASVRCVEDSNDLQNVTITGQTHKWDEADSIGSRSRDAQRRRDSMELSTTIWMLVQFDESD